MQTKDEMRKIKDTSSPVTLLQILYIATAAAVVAKSEVPKTYFSVNLLAVKSDVLIIE